MKLQAHNNKLVTNVKAETQEFGIGNASVVIDILRNRLYEHKIRTLVQEYMCNGRDAMREIGNNKPIEVTVPTHFSPTFKVRDFGPGITPERMQKVFVMYGASTKRDNNNQTGGFGIGAKSAWSYTDSFTIVTYVDGVKRTYIAHTGVNNNGRLDLIGTETTKEENGTEIQIAVKKDDVGEFVDAVRRASYFWKTTPIIKGLVDETPTNKYLEVVPSLQVVEGDLPNFIEFADRWDSSKIGLVIDGVPYSISEKIVNRSPGLKKLNERIASFALVHIDNGVVEVSASRESVADSDFTIRNLDLVVSGIVTKLMAFLGQEFKKVNEVSELIETYNKYSKCFNLDTFHVKGYTVSNNSLKSPIFAKVNLTKHYWKHSYRNNSKPKLVTEELDGLFSDSISLVHTVQASDSGIMKNRRVRHYLDQSGLPLNSYAKNLNAIILLTPKDGDIVSYDKVVSDLKTKVLDIELPVVEKIKTPKPKLQDTQLCMHVFDGARHEYTTLAGNETHWLYVPITDAGYDGFEGQELKDLNEHLRKFRENIRVCALANRAIKMVQGDKNFQKLSDWLAKFKATKEELNSVKRKAALNTEYVEVLQNVAKHALNDKFLKEMISEYEGFRNADNGLNTQLLIDKVLKSDKYLGFIDNDKQLNDLIKKTYPLIKDLSQWTKETSEIAFYLNAKFATK